MNEDRIEDLGLEVGETEESMKEYHEEVMLEVECACEERDANYLTDAKMGAI